MKMATAVPVFPSVTVASPILRLGGGGGGGDQVPSLSNTVTTPLPSKSPCLRPPDPRGHRR